LAKAEPKALRYRLLHVPAKLTTGGRRRRLRIPSNWPWATAIVSAFAKIAAIPSPGWATGISPARPTKAPRRTATRKRHPGRRHTHRPTDSRVSR